MSQEHRRLFLKKSATIVSGLAAASCAPSRETVPVGASSILGILGSLDRTTLDAVGRVVLPKGALGDDGVARVLDDFVKWLDAFEPVAELDHYYLWNDEIAYGPHDPGPLWRSQLEALELEAQKRHESSFSAVDVRLQEAILHRQLPRETAQDLPYAGDAPHVAIGLLAYFYRTSEANDLGYGAAIEKQTCRGLDTSPDEPKPLGS